MKPIGAPTRGTTNPNRLRRVDAWIAATLGGALRGAADPVVVDLGYGASPVTAVQLRARLARVRPDVRVVGVEIDPVRVAEALPAAALVHDQAGGGAEHHDGTGAGALQRGQQRLGHPDRTQHVDLVHPLPVGRLGRLDRVDAARPAGVVDQQCQLAGEPLDGVPQPGDVDRPGDVGDHAAQREYRQWPQATGAIRPQTVSVPATGQRDSSGYRRAT